MTEKSSSVPPIQLQDINGNKVPATTSLAIAEFTGIKHFHILETLGKLLETGKFSESNFRFSVYQGTRREERMCILDEMITSVIIMRSKSDNALDWQIAYTKEFQRMRTELNNTKVLRKKGDEFALADQMQKLILLSKRRDLGKDEKTDSFACRWISERTNELAFGYHQTGMRQEMTPQSSYALSRSLLETTKEIVSGEVNPTKIKEKIEARRSIASAETKKKIAPTT